MKLSTLILPIYPWSQGGQVWRRAEQSGLYAAYTYDHLSWREFRDRPWYGAVPTLAAAAVQTSSIRLGTMVTSPTFRHPVPLAKELMTLDELSGGRFTAGIGAGGNGFDVTVLGEQALAPRRKADRFAEFVGLLDELLTQPRTSASGAFYQADEASMYPGCVQRPRLPFAVAGAGPRAVAVAARYGQAWLTAGPASGGRDMSPAQAYAEVAAQAEWLDKAAAEIGRDPAQLDRILLSGFTGDDLLSSVDAFVDYAGRYAQLGFTEIVVHWPVPDSVFDADPVVFERIISEAPGQLASV